MPEIEKVFDTSLRNMPGPNRTFPITPEVLQKWEMFKPEQKGARYLDTLSEIDRTNVEHFISFAPTLRSRAGGVGIAIEAVGSSTQPESDRLFGEVHDIDMRVLSSTAPGTEERETAVGSLRDGIRDYLQSNGIPFKEEDCTVEHRMVPMSRLNQETGRSEEVLGPFTDYDNGDPSFVARPQKGLPLHIFISGADNYSLEDHLKLEVDRKTSAVVLLEDTKPLPEPEMQLGDDEKAMYPESWAQDAILAAWNTGKPTFARRPDSK